MPHAPADHEEPMTIATPELMLRSMTDDWTLARWEALPDDGNRVTKYERRSTKYE